MAERVLSQDQVNETTQDQLQSSQDQVQSTQDQIKVMVSGQDGSLIHFKLKMNTRMGKLMREYCDRQGFNISNLRFFFDGQPLNEWDTPNSLGMEDEDVIDVFHRQSGGEGSCLALLLVV